MATKGLKMATGTIVDATIDLASMSSSPAIALSKVDLPQPDGPSMRDINDCGGQALVQALQRFRILSTLRWARLLLSVH